MSDTSATVPEAPETAEGWQRATFPAVGSGAFGDEVRPDLPANVPAWRIVTEAADGFVVDYCPPEAAAALPLAPPPDLTAIEPAAAPLEPTPRPDEVYRDEDGVLRAI